jgi:hypothetical protein
MRKYLLAALLLLPCLPVYAEDAAPAAPQVTSEKPKSRSLDAFVQEVLTNGRDRTMNSDTTGAVGLSGDMPSKAIRYKASISPDQRGHAFHILYQTTSDGKLETTNMIWISEKKQTVGSDQYFDSMNFLVSMTGELKAAASFKGKVNNTLPVKLNIKSAKVKEAFAAEKRFYLADSVPLEYSTK